MTARPEVEHRKINPMNGEKLRFVIMATDGRKLTEPLIEQSMTVF